MEVTTQRRYARDLVIAEMTSISAKTLRNWRLRRRGPPWYALGGHALYDIAEVISWIREHRAPHGVSQEIKPENQEHRV